MRSAAHEHSRSQRPPINLPSLALSIFLWLLAAFGLVTLFFFLRSSVSILSFLPSRSVNVANSAQLRPFHFSPQQVDLPYPFSPYLSHSPFLH